MAKHRRHHKVYRNPSDHTLLIVGGLAVAGVVAYVMFGTSAIMAALLGSASGTAATVMPVLAPLADVLHFSKQTVVLAFQMASGAFNFWMPWDGIAFTICSMAGVNFFKYIKASAKFAVLVYVPVALLLLALAVEIGYRLIVSAADVLFLADGSKQSSEALHSLQPDIGKRASTSQNSPY